jgi:hypothetical protein
MGDPFTDFMMEMDRRRQEQCERDVRRYTWLVVFFVVVAIGYVVMTAMALWRAFR